MTTKDTHLSNNPCWFAFRTKPRAEKKSLETLERYGYTCYLPLIETIKQWSDRKKKIKIPLLPGYIFVRLTHNEIGGILAFSSIVDVVKYLKQPAQVRDYEINNIKILINDTDNATLSEDPELTNGDKIAIHSGNFQGMIGHVVHVQNKHRVYIEIEALKSKFEVNVPISFIHKLIV